MWFHFNKPVVKLQAKTLSDATPPIGKINPFSKIYVKQNMIFDFLEILNALNLCNIVKLINGGTLPNHMGFAAGDSVN